MCKHREYFMTFSHKTSTYYTEHSYVSLSKKYIVDQDVTSLHGPHPKFDNLPCEIRTKVIYCERDKKSV